MSGKNVMQGSGFTCEILMMKTKEQVSIEYDLRVKLGNEERKPQCAISSINNTNLFIYCRSNLSRLIYQYQLGKFPFGRVVVLTFHLELVTIDNGKANKMSQYSFQGSS